MRLSLLAVAAVLAACSAEPDPREPASAPAAAPQVPGRPAIYAAAEQGPEAFVRALYAVYESGGPQGEQPPPGRDPIYGRTMNAMIGEDFRKAGGEVPFLNFDPICDCQDWGPFRLDSVTVTETGQNKADAAVVFTNGETQVRQTLKLEREGPMWRVADIVKDGEAPLSEQLLKVIS
jgi:hypothetical protein